MGSISALVRIEDSTGKRCDATVRRAADGYPPVVIRLGPGLTYTAAANGSEETVITISPSGVATLDNATPASLGGNATPGAGASANASRADHVHPIALASESYAGLMSAADKSRLDNIAGAIVSASITPGIDLVLAALYANPSATTDVTLTNVRVVTMALIGQSPTDFWTFGIWTIDQLVAELSTPGSGTPLASVSSEARSFGIGSIVELPDVVCPAGTALFISSIPTGSPAAARPGVFVQATLA